MISRVRIGGISSLELRTNPEIGGFSSSEIGGFSNPEVSSGLCPTGVGSFPAAVVLGKQDVSVDWTPEDIQIYWPDHLGSHSRLSKW